MGIQSIFATMKKGVENISAKASAYNEGKAAKALENLKKKNLQLQTEAAHARIEKPLLEQIEKSEKIISERDKVKGRVKDARKKEAERKSEKWNQPMFKDFWPGEQAEQE